MLAQVRPLVSGRDQALVGNDYSSAPRFSNTITLDCQAVYLLQMPQENNAWRHGGASDRDAGVGRRHSDLLYHRASRGSYEKPAGGRKVLHLMAQDEDSRAPFTGQKLSGSR